MDPLDDCYISAARIVLQADCTDPSTWRELHALLQILREHFSCRVCRSLVDRPKPYLAGFACTACANAQTTDVELADVVFLQNFKAMCSQVIRMASLYRAICARDEDRRLVELLNEVAGPTNRRNGLVNGVAVIKQEANHCDNVRSNTATPIVQRPSVKIETPSNVNVGLQAFDVRPENRKIENQPKPNVIPTKRKVCFSYFRFPIKKFYSNNYVLQRNVSRSGCRCGKASSFPGKLTCFGQRCPCYTEQRPCDQCKCRGCRNPRQKQSNNDDNVDQDQIRRKPVTLELVSSLKPSNLKIKPVIYTFFSVLLENKIKIFFIDFRHIVLTQCKIGYNSLQLVQMVMNKLELKSHSDMSTLFFIPLKQ